MYMYSYGPVIHCVFLVHNMSTHIYVYRHDVEGNTVYDTSIGVGHVMYYVRVYVQVVAYETQIPTT